MSYDHAEGEVSAVYRAAGEPDLQAPTNAMTFVAPGSVTRRQFGLSAAT